MSPPEAAPTPWPVLSLDERRILGVLIEKSKTTPDAYPMSVNALVTGSNQKSNRDPIMDLDDFGVEEALGRAAKKGLVTRVVSTSGRVERWKHNVYDVWKLSKVEIALIAELLLRGPQTEGELRGRAGRMEPLEDLDILRSLLKPLAERLLVVYLTPEGRRGTVVTHGFHAPEELQKLRARFAGTTLDDDEPRPTRTIAPMVSEQPERTPRLDAAIAEIADLRRVITELQSEMKILQDQVRTIKEGLGL